MLFEVHPSRLTGEVAIPGSKSHTIRAVMIAALADGESVIDAPLISADAESAMHAAGILGAKITRTPDRWVVQGTGGRFHLRETTIDTGNSGTTTNILLGLLALQDEREITLTGDQQIRRRPCRHLADALTQLGAKIVSVHENGCPPFLVRGPLRGGRAVLAAPSSQYLTSLLLACPLAVGDSEIVVTELKEESYVEMTLEWLKFQGICLEHDGLKHFRIPGGQKYHAFHRRVPADFSSASFFLCAGALGDNDVTSTGLDLNDAQGDKAVVDYLRQMGALVEVTGDRIRVRGRGLHGVELDLNNTPDALPVMAVTACFAEGTTVLGNVAHARIKETDRIAVMAGELRKIGAAVEERPDGLVIHGGQSLTGADVNGHHDHRVVMALALAGTRLQSGLTVDTAEAAGVTFPEFPRMMRTLGAALQEREIRPV